MKALFSAGIALIAMVACTPQEQSPFNVSPPSGMQWNPTFDDEFTQDSSLDQSKWNGGASNTDWCNNTEFWFSGTGQRGNNGGNYMFAEPYDNPCQNNPGNIAFSSTDGLQMRTPNDHSTDASGIAQGSPDAAMTTANKFIQRYGYWEASIKKSACTGDHFDFWMHAQPEGPNSIGQWGPEINVGEEPSWDTGQDAAESYAQFDLADFTGVGGGSINTGVNLSAGFHTYGMWWKDDGSGPYGSISMFFDGQQVGGPWSVSSQATNFANGIYVFLSLDGGCSDWQNNPTDVRYVRSWQLR